MDATCPDGKWNFVRYLEFRSLEEWIERWGVGPDILYYLEGTVPDKRYKDLCALADKLESECNELDTSVRTADEQETLAQHGGYTSIVIGKTVDNFELQASHSD